VAKDLAVQAYWWWGGGPSGVSLERRPPVDKVSLGDANAYLTSPSPGPNLPEYSLQRSNVHLT